MPSTPMDEAARCGRLRRARPGRAHRLAAPPGRNRVPRRASWSSSAASASGSLRLVPFAPADRRARGGAPQHGADRAAATRPTGSSPARRRSRRSKADVEKRAQGGRVPERRIARRHASRRRDRARPRVGLARGGSRPRASRRARVVAREPLRVRPRDRVVGEGAARRRPGRPRRLRVRSSGRRSRRRPGTRATRSSAGRSGARRSCRRSGASRSPTRPRS